MAAKELPDVETLRKLLDYDPASGILTWKPRSLEMFPNIKSGKRWNTKHAKKEAFTGVLGTGYRSGYVFNEPYKAHRIIWAIYYGEDPISQIDHINGDRADNRIENLRIASAAENSKNRARRNDNKSGVTGVTWDKGTNKWRACIRVNHKTQYLGVFPDIEAAVAARKAAELKLGFHANHGRSCP
jgi:hypothetical protein